MKYKKQYIKKQQGAVLVMALVMLTVLTLIGVSSMSSSTLELKVAGNTQQHDVAFQAAQSVIDIAASKDPLNTNNYQVFITDSANPALTGVCCINMDDKVTDNKIDAIFKAVSQTNNE